MVTRRRRPRHTVETAREARTPRGRHGPCSTAVVQNVQRLAGWLFAVHALGCSASAEAPALVQPVTEAPEIQAGPRQGTGRVEGQVDGRTLAVADARIFAGSLSSRDSSRRGVRIVLTDRPGLCAKPDVAHPNEQTLGFELDFQAGALALGAYTVPVAFGPEGAAVAGRLDATSATCSTKTFLALEGRVTIEEADAVHTRGTFELTLGRETVRGAFDAVPCAGEIAPPVATTCER